VEWVGQANEQHFWHEEKNLREKHETNQTCKHTYETNLIKFGEILKIVNVCEIESRFRSLDEKVLYITREVRPKLPLNFLPPRAPLGSHNTNRETNGKRVG
jgi:hypothetical protein